MACLEDALLVQRQKKRRLLTSDSDDVAWALERERQEKRRLPPSPVVWAFTDGTVICKKAKTSGYLEFARFFYHTGPKERRVAMTIVACGHAWRALSEDEKKAWTEKARLKQEERGPAGTIEVSFTTALHWHTRWKESLTIQLEMALDARIPSWPSPLSAVVRDYAHGSAPDLLRVPSI